MFYTVHVFIRYNFPPYNRAKLKSDALYIFLFVYVPFSPGFVFSNNGIPHSTFHIDMQKELVGKNGG